MSVRDGQVQVDGGPFAEPAFDAYSLARACECFDGWRFSLEESLTPLIETGAGQPDEA